jgi:hypothetical protein
MKLHKLSILGGLLGIGIIIYSVIQWSFLYPDQSQMAFGLSIGVIVCIASYVYNWMRNQDEDNKKRDKRLDAFTTWWAEKEMK